MEDTKVLITKYKVLAFICNAAFAHNVNADWALSSEVMTSGKLHYHLSYQGVYIVNTYNITEIFTYLYFRNIPISEVRIDFNIL